MDIVNSVGDDILKLVFAYLLRFKDIENATAVCKTWRRIMKEMYPTIPRYKT